MMKKFLLYLWQLPQNLLGLLVIHLIKANKAEWNGITYYKTKYLMGVSLGQYIILYKFSPNDSILHEYGHTKQSLFLGWLYLPVVGIPSAIFNNLWDRLAHQDWTYTERELWYYQRFPEKWADKLGGVRRY